VAFFGADRPDVPAEAVRRIDVALAEADVAIGAAPDGGYWMLAARRHQRHLLRGIDWGSECVYDQALYRAREAGSSLCRLPQWFDVDRPEDVMALRKRLQRRAAEAEHGPDPALRRLAGCLDELLDDPAQGGRHALMNENDILTTLQGNPSEAELPDLTGASILLVDDNLQNLELMQAYLEALPCRIRTAADGVEAMELIEDEEPDLILLDVMMPRMSGFEVCQKIKASPRWRDVIIVMVTALHEVGDFERAIECGTDDFLTKPVNKLELLTRVKSLLRVRLLKRRLDQLMALDRHIAPDEGARTGAGQKLEEQSEST
jgi:two-component system alkaline phosphatase synthesis response regulator PhoP